MTAAQEILIRVATDFSDTPGPRHRSEGDFSGDEFLEDVLLPAFERAQESGSLLVVNLDDCAGFATSFLEAAFGGLARKHGADAVEKVVRIVATDEPLLAQEIAQYIADTRG